MIEAAIEVLKEGGLSALTLAEVSRRSRVSIGSIYCRVDGKDALLREVQAVVLHDIEREFALLVNRVRRKTLQLPELIPALVRELAMYLRRHSALLSAFMQQGDQDPIVEAVGRKAYQQNVLDFKLVLLERHSEFHHPDPEQAATTCFTVIYASLARFLGLGVSPSGQSSTSEAEWKQLVEDLGLMTLAFLTADSHAIQLPSGKLER